MNVVHFFVGREASVIFFCNTMHTKFSHDLGFTCICPKHQSSALNQQEIRIEQIDPKFTHSNRNQSEPEVKENAL